MAGMKMKCVLLQAAIALILAETSSACLWYQGTTIDGHFGPYGTDAFGSPKDLAAMILRQPQSEPKLFKDHHYSSANPVGKGNDRAVRELLRGNAKRAVAMLHEVEAAHPGNYFTAANLGTAYELAGDDVNALKWIQEGIRRDPDSHMQTEWLHVRILETKIRLQAEPDRLSKSSITGADLGKIREENYALTTEQGEKKARDLQKALFRQLSVRMLFVKPQDGIVAHLLKELALCEAQLGILENAEAYALLAVKYGLPVEELKATVLDWRRIRERAAGMDR